jgi:hypothetical protein
MSWRAPVISAAGLILVDVVVIEFVFVELILVIEVVLVVLVLVELVVGVEVVLVELFFLDGRVKVIGVRHISPKHRATAGHLAWAGTYPALAN